MFFLVFVCFYVVSFSGQNLLKPLPGVTKGLSHAQIVSSKGQIQNFRLASRLFHMGVAPRMFSQSLSVYNILQLEHSIVY